MSRSTRLAPRARAVRPHAARPRRAFLALLAAWLAAAQPAPAAAAEPDVLAELSLEDLTRIPVARVVSATKTEQRSDQAPSAVSVITASEIRQFGWTTLSEVLAATRGFYVTNNRYYDYVGVRGFSRPGDLNTRVLVLIDGHRINDGIYGQGSVDGVLPIDLDLVERIEIVRGPGSALYGTGAFFAVINVIPKSAGALGGGEAAVRVGSRATAGARLSGGKRFDSGLEVTASASGYRTDGDRRYVLAELAGDAAAGFGVIRDADAERWGSGYLNVRQGATSLTAATGSRRRDSGSGLFGTTFGDPANYTNDRHAYLDFNTSREVGAHGTVFARLSYHEYRWHGAGVPIETPQVRNLEGGDSGWWGAELRYLARLGERHRVTVGLEQLDQFRNRQRSTQAGAAVPFLDMQAHYDNTAVYVQDEIALGKRLTATLGVRHDRLDYTRTSTSPRLALVYLPDDVTAVKALYGSAFRAPNAYERVYAFAGYMAANPDLRPEHIRTAELVLERSLAANLRATASLYRYGIDGLITQSVRDDGLLQYTNLGRVSAHGAELELQAHVGLVRLRASYSAQRAVNAGGERLTNSPAQLGQIALQAPLAGPRWMVGWTAQLVGSRTGESASGTTPRVPGYAVHNLNLLATRLAPGLDLSVGLFNLANRRYFAPVSADDDARLQGIVQTGRTLRAKLSYAF